MIITAPHYFKDRHCGYCKDTKIDHYALNSQWERLGKGKKSSIDDKKESVMVGSSVLQMTCEEYDQLINQGFRRSGNFMYKPDLLNSCCRLYTIRTNDTYLHLTKQHRKIINKFIKLIAPELPSPKKNTFDFENLYSAQVNSKNFFTKFEPSSFSEEKFQLYKKYQVIIHNDDPDEVSEASFKRFLCDTPFSQEQVSGKHEQFEALKPKNWSSQKSKRIGPTHELYYLDDKLIAISIMDFLPSGISSIYFIWDPDYAHLSLGTLSGLKEIQMCKKLGYDWYYLGYFIEDCTKMKYKQQFGGELLDLCNEVYFPIEKIKPMIENDRLFVIGENSQDVFQELEVENNGKPLQFQSSEFVNSPLINIAEEIYGKSDIKSDAKKYATILKQKYGIIVSKFSELPFILPGSIPLWQIVEWFENGVLDDEFEVEVFMSGKVLQISLKNMIPEGRGLVIDSIRLFGLEKVQDSVIVLN